MHIFDFSTPYNKNIKLIPQNIQVSLQILMENQVSIFIHYYLFRSTLILKIIFIILTFFITSIIFIDFIYIVGNVIQRQIFNSLNDLAMNQFQLCSIKNDIQILDMIQRHRDIFNINKRLICNHTLISFLKMQMQSYLQVNTKMAAFSKNTQNTHIQNISQSTTPIEVINSQLIKLLISMKKGYQHFNGLILVLKIQFRCQKKIFGNQSILNKTFLYKHYDLNYFNSINKISIVRKIMSIMPQKMTIPIHIPKNQKNKTYINDSQVLITGILEELKN
ncbi:unnamed protein product [Paramecium sonneborni]|uniref:Transmembrane protein n=1 Tax=Paramecium sonneborni TaxID=65129 RepID=A0A8S1P7R0_9CILI|nr:unnamed protein product [Paramecium sonneborni]